MAPAVPSVLKAEVSSKGRHTPSKGPQSSPTGTSWGPTVLRDCLTCKDIETVSISLGRETFFAALNIIGCCQQGSGDMVSVSLVSRVRHPWAVSLCCPLAGNLQRGLHDRALPP